MTPLPNGRMIGAEVLKLRKRRGLMIAASLLTVGIVLVVNIVLVVLHAVNPEHHGPAGGAQNLAGAANAVSFIGAVAAVLVGTTAGAGDLSAGVFRELVVTGRSRVSLFLARIPGGLVVLFTLVLLAYGASAIVAVTANDFLARPSAKAVATGALWLLLATGFYFVLSLGLASVVGSRATSIAIMLAFRLAVEPLILAIGFLGASRKALPFPSIQRLAPSAVADEVGQAADLQISIGLAVLVLVVWVAVVTAAGAWRTQRRDA